MLCNVFIIHWLCQQAKKLCIEADGPYHYYNSTHDVNATTLMKHRHLSELDWHVISIPYWEWQSLHTPKAKRLYLKARLAMYKRLR